MLGYSVYFSNLDMKYVQKMDKLGVKTVFTSLHIPEEQLDKQKIKEFLRDSKEQNRDVVIDISPNTLEALEIRDLVELKELGIKTLRIDWGLQDKEIVRLQKDFRIVLNASTLSEEQLLNLQSQGLNLFEVISMHNFYPREETGISEEFFLENTELVKRFGISVWAFIPGERKLRGPIFAGLPTLEKHRFQSPYVSFVDLRQGYLVDGVFIGDIAIGDETLENIITFEKDQILTLPTNELDKGISKDTVFTIRCDEPKSVIRIEEGRAIFANSDLTRDTNRINERKTGSICIDNKNYLRYAGEMQIMKHDLRSDYRVNVVGSIQTEFHGLLNYAKGRTKIRFK